MQICYIDIIDKCNLRCPTCVRGTQLLKNSAASMPINLFKEIVEKAKSEGYDTIGVYNWIEPFLCKDLEKFVSIIKDSGLDCELSSNLSLKPASYFDNIRQALLKGVDRLTVSVSGYNQEIYQINHVGGNVSWIKENLEQIALLKRTKTIRTEVFLRFIKFDYNNKEEPLLREYAHSLGLKFEVIEGVGHPSHSIDKYESESFCHDRLKNFNPSRIHEENGEICSLIMDTIAINSQGNVYICCIYPYYSSLRIGSYLEMSKHDILLKRYSHPICPSCGFPRRKATVTDCSKLVNAIEFRLGFSKNSDNLIGNIDQIGLLKHPPTLLHKLRKAFRNIVGSRISRIR